MKIVSAVGAKGGTGKSSVALLLAWELSKKNRKVAIFDVDIQGTCVSAQELNKSLPFKVYAVGNKRELIELGDSISKENYDYLIIDGNPRSIHEDPELIEIIAQLSDLSLIVSRPTPKDLKAQIKYVNVVRENTNGAVRIVWNFFQKQMKTHSSSILEGEKLLGISSLKNKIGLRAVYQDMGFSECYIGEMNNKYASEEIKSLCDEIIKVCNG